MPTPISAARNFLYKPEATSRAEIDRFFQKTRFYPGKLFPFVHLGFSLPPSCPKFWTSLVVGPGFGPTILNKPLRGAFLSQNVNGVLYRIACSLHLIRLAQEEVMLWS